VHPYLRLELRVQPVNAPAAGSLPPAPLVRRVLGKALVDTFCSFGEPRCQATEGPGPARPTPSELCQLAESCPYGVLFAASRSPRPPFALYVAETGEEGACLLELTLLGPGWKLYPWALSAVRQALDLGLGKERQRYRVETIGRVRPDRTREIVCGGDLTALSAALHPDALSLGLEPFLAPQPVGIRLLSPTRLLQDGKLLPGRAPVPFDLLIARILDRFQGLFGPAGSEVLHPAIRATVEAEASRVPRLSDETSWVEVRDYSARSGSEMLLGGKVGQLVYGPEAARFFPSWWPARFSTWARTRPRAAGGSK
jgi:hypothetical protein